MDRIRYFFGPEGSADTRQRYDPKGRQALQTIAPKESRDHRSRVHLVDYSPGSALCLSHDDSWAPHGPNPFALSGRLVGDTAPRNATRAVRTLLETQLHGLSMG